VITDEANDRAWQETVTKALEGWLQWATTELHVRAGDRAARMPKGESDAVCYFAAQLLYRRAGWLNADLGRYEQVSWALENHPAAFGKLVRALHAADLAMRAEVPEPVRAEVPPGAVEHIPYPHTSRMHETPTEARQVAAQFDRIMMGGRRSGMTTFMDRMMANEYEVRAAQQHRAAEMMQARNEKLRNIERHEQGPNDWKVCDCAQCKARRLEP
jgi:hypothetical protein